MSKNTLSAQVREDSALYDGFEEYRERHGFESKSEAVRSALRQGVEGDQADARAESASRSTLTAIGLLAAAELLSIPTTARYTLLAAVGVFALAGVYGYATVARELIGDQVGIFTDDVDDREEDDAVASMSPTVRLVGGILMLVTLGITVVSGWI